MTAHSDMLPLELEPSPTTAPAIAPRPYQAEALDTIARKHRAGVNRQVVVLPTGCGKTIVFASLIHRRPGRKLVLAHRDELIQQAADKLAQVTGNRLGIGIVKAKQNDAGAETVIGSVQTLCRPGRTEQLGRFDTVIVDECFPAGTTVGGRRIERVGMGDLVPSWNEQTGQVEHRPVTAVMRRRPSGLVRVWLQDGQRIVCTPDHPFLTPGGWRPARRLYGASVISSHHADATGTVRGVRGPGHANRQGEDRHLPPQWAGVLLGPAPGYLDVPGPVSPDGPDQPKVRIGADDRAQPDERSGFPGEDVGDAQGNRAQAANTGRQWPGSYGCAEGAGGSAWLADGVHCPDRPAGERRPANPLQTGPGAPGREGSHRGRRRLARVTGRAGTGPAQGRLAHCRRVDRVEVLEPGSDGRYGGLCPDGHVYNLEVAGNHTYLIDGGVVVHNCHHSTADTYRDVLDRLGCMEADGPLTVGFTATAQRTDKVGLGEVWQEITYRRGILQMIAEGYLVDVRGQQIGSDFNLANLKTKAGDYTDGSIGDELERSDALQAMVRGYQQYAYGDGYPDGRLALGFMPTIATAHALADAFNAAGIPAGAVDGTMPIDERREQLRRIHVGEIRVLSNCAVLTEGYDEPAISCVLMGRPTKSPPFFTQMTGRALRPFTGKVAGRRYEKTDALVLDVAGAADLGLATLATLAGLKPGSVKPGDSLLDAAEQLGDEERRRVAIGAVRTRQIDLLRRSERHWLDVDGSWILPVSRETVMILVPAAGAGDMDDAWEVWRSDNAPPVRESAATLTLEWARGVGEEIARAQDSKLSRSDAEWRKRPASDGQVGQLRKLRVTIPEEGLTRGAASDLLTAKFAARDIRKIRRAAPKRGAE